MEGQFDPKKDCVKPGYALFLLQPGWGICPACQVKGNPLGTWGSYTTDPDCPVCFGGTMWSRLTHNVNAQVNRYFYFFKVVVKEVVRVETENGSVIQSLVVVPLDDSTKKITVTDLDRLYHTYDSAWRATLLRTYRAIGESLSMIRLDTTSSYLESQLKKS